MEPSSFSNIVVRLPNWIGDAVMCLPALMDLRDHFPHAKITVLARPSIGELISQYPTVDEVMSYAYQEKHKGFLGLWTLIREVKRKQFDCAVVFQNAFEAAFIMWTAGIPSRIGYATDGRSCFLSERIQKPDLRSLHHVQYYQHLISVLTHSSGKNRSPHLILSSEVREACVSRFPEIFLRPDHTFIGINPGSVYGSAKRWLPESFAQVGDRLLERMTGELSGSSPVQCVLIGGKGEEWLAQNIAGRMRHKPIIMTGRTTIQELMGILSRCAVLVTNDTGPMHVAQALDVPVAAIFGSTDPAITGPFGSSQGVAKVSVRCAPCFLRACPIDHRCMTGVTIEQVVEIAWELIKLSSQCKEGNHVRGHAG